jgi:nucleoside diphosphate kinase
MTTYETADQLRHILKGKDYILPVEVPEGFQNFVYDNLIHSSDSPESAKRELAIFFTPEELI